MREMLHLDSRLDGIDLTDALSVFKALGGKRFSSENHFDTEAYLTLPIGARLLTMEEVVSLPVEQQKPIPEKPGDPYYGEWFMENNCGFGNLGHFYHNWDPENKKLVYTGEIPEELVWVVRKVKGPNALAEEEKQREERNRQMQFYMKEIEVIESGRTLKE